MNHTIRRISSVNLSAYSKELINNYHSYIKYSVRPGRKVYYALFEDDVQVGVFGIGSAFTFPKAVQDFMLENNIGFNEIGNNIVYVLHGNKDKNAGTTFLKLIRNDAIIWWYERYGDTLKAFQTFILPPRTGAMYKADNWELIGETAGYSFKTRTLTVDELKDIKPSIDSKDVIIQRYDIGERKDMYVERTLMDVDKKLIFVRKISEKDISRAMRKIENKNQYKNRFFS